MRANEGPMQYGFPFSRLDMLTGTVNVSLNGNPTADFFARWGIDSPSDEQRLQAYVDLAWINWRFREGYVNRAQALCFPNGSVTPQCNEDDPKIEKLSTAREDQAFRIFQAGFLKLFKTASSDVQSEIQSALGSRATAVKLCQAGVCTMSDILLDPHHIHSMTSSPTAPLASRYGF
jgi:hypothetical protein